MISPLGKISCILVLKGLPEGSILAAVGLPRQERGIYLGLGIGPICQTGFYW